MLNKESITIPTALREVINQVYRAQEFSLVTHLCTLADLPSQQKTKIRNLAIELVTAIQVGRKKSTGIDSFLSEYALSSEEGIALMCLAEALLRIPDSDTIDSLIRDKLSSKAWGDHQGKSESFFVNATTWALMLTGKLLNPSTAEASLTQALMAWIGRNSEALLRTAVERAMRIMSKQFVMGRTIHEALARAKKKEVLGYKYSYDMLGEAALTAKDAKRYFDAYQFAIEALGLKGNREADVHQNAGISIKLSALHPRYQENQHERVMQELPPKLLALAQRAKSHHISLTVDAEESERLDLSLDIIEKVISDESLDGWDGFGLAVQSYQKRALYVLDWLAALARKNNKRIMVRLIKGAYWDSEIKKTQMQGLKEYPVFTRKVYTDVSFQACAKKILTMTDALYPQFATHNAYSVAMILNLVGDYRDFEFQCLHGMGKELYEYIAPYKIPCRIYAPVGTHEKLLPYLVRRLLENGANSSFVNQVVNRPLSKVSLESELVADPIARAQSMLTNSNTNIPLPENLFLPLRNNSLGFDFSDRYEKGLLQQTLKTLPLNEWKAGPIVQGFASSQSIKSVFSPQCKTSGVGLLQESSVDDVELALTQAQHAFAPWSQTAVKERASRIKQFANLLQTHRAELMALACLEAGKTWSDALAELREAIDFCFYYAAMAEQLMANPMSLKGYTGELNELSLHPRGIVLCISPWNFPLAIFTGQVVAALVLGNCVIAKPAEQTPLIAAFAVRLMHQAGIPAGVVQLVPGAGDIIGAALVADLRIKAVLFTGSTDTANHINKTLATRGGELIPFIAETGGQNAMIVDSSALLEQVVVDVITSAFGSAGQRCSALRVLFVQEEVYLLTVELLKGAMAELVIGDPQWLRTDVGPVIDEKALAVLKDHVERMKLHHQILYQCPITQDMDSGYFMPPTLIAVDHIRSLKNEVFGPILHIIPFKRSNLDDVIAQINQTGYGLTLGIHSRINDLIDNVRSKVNAGNCYVNRNMIGAVVGLQPFGGEGLSGTGPKAGGPNYLVRLCHERTYTVDTTAAGGNATLMCS